MAVLYIVILIGVLVFVHEFGHYVAARIFHVKVLTFSIGFGPRLFGFERGGTSWDVRLLPLGGYVQMYGTDFEEVTDPDDPDFKDAYNNKPIWQKAIINLAGPLFNLILPIPILFAVYFATVTTDLPPYVGQVLDNSPAVEKLLPGDVVTHIDGEEVRYWGVLHDIIADNPGRTLRFDVLRDGQPLSFDITPQDTVLRDAMDILDERVGRIGITPDPEPAIISIASSTGTGAAAGLRTFDEIVTIDGESVHSYVDVERLLRRPGDAHEIAVLRPRPIDVPYGSVFLLEPVKVRVESPESGAAGIGIASCNMCVTDVDPDSPAAAAGIMPGDRILTLDGASVNIFRSFVDKLTQKWEEPHEVTLQRGDEVISTKIQLVKMTITGEFQEEIPLIYAGFYHRLPAVSVEPVAKTVGDRLTSSMARSLEITVRASTLLAVSVVRMFQGRVSTKSLGGPIMIGHMASKAGQEGIDMFLRMLAIISINLGILNLLPIPLFDGGKLAILGVEAIKRGPISMRARQIIAYVGLALVALLLMLAFKNDLERMWNLFFS